MITEKQWKIFVDCKGDADIIFRSARKKEQALMEGFDWGLIWELLQDLHMLYNDLLSEEYKKKTLAKFESLECEPLVRDKIVEYAKNLNVREKPSRSFWRKWW
jgi:hypothetical protein